MSAAQSRVSTARGVLGFALVLGAALVVLAVAYGTARLSDTHHCQNVVPDWAGAMEVRNFQIFCADGVGDLVLAFDGRGAGYGALGFAGLLLVLAFVSLNPRWRSEGDG
ncbi:hypothetical protein C8046_16795 [Serinibacter arcticus]|uniref:Uncharacterized protein n=1 Tax=Serinibacter arcticus TaxID=1655435 RepID=A0A2U1ZYJ3_9MICO|nr:hypothetical protein [Serinibacter arcticus]PWD52056.1 hypothetical protein C8046_16795 [Serinibacter arcticus]